MVRRRHLERAPTGHHTAVVNGVLHSAQAVAKRVLDLCVCSGREDLETGWWGGWRGERMGAVSTSKRGGARSRDRGWGLVAASAPAC